MKKLIALVFCLGSTLIFHSCSKSPDPAPAAAPLGARAGADIAVTLGSDVTLDGSQSTGPAGFTYEWSYISTTIPESAINFRNKTAAKATFTPSAGGTYDFKLKVTSGTATSDDDVRVTVNERTQVIGGTLSDGFKFNNIEPDPTKPDYKITSSVVITNAGVQSLDDIVLEFAEGTGIEFKGFATLTGGKFTSQTNWKGILLSNGVGFSLTNGVIVNAGVGLFAGQTESAAVTNGVGTLTLINSTFVGTTGYDVLSPYKVTLTGNTFSSQKPVKLDGNYLPNMSGNTFPANYDYITVTTSEPDKTLNASSRVVFGPLKYFIANDIYVINTNLQFAAGATLFVAEGAGIFTRDSVTMKGTADKPITMKGLNGAHWKGLALYSQASVDVIDIDHLVMTDAGSANFNNATFFTSEVAAAIHVGARVSIKNSQITSFGYGISFATDDNAFNYNAPVTAITGNTFHSALPSVRADYSRVGDFLPGGHGNIFDPAAGIAAVELVNYKTIKSGGSMKDWFPLGQGQFYLVNTDIIISSALTLQPGVVLKFKAGKSLYTPLPPSPTSYFPGLFLTAIGTPSKHIIFDSEAGTPGSWGGLSLNETFDLEYCEIRNGGGLITTGATEKANLTIRSFVGTGVYYFSNNLTTGSAGYGIVLENGAPNKDVDFPPNNNVYTNNASGDLKFK